MTNTPDTCPNQEDGRHRFHIYRIADVYEPIDWSTVTGGFIGKLPESLYEKVEYAYSGCNCGAARKTRIAREADI